ncbi:MAG: hypothetical protein KF858_03990 [Candidatus Sumerlaeia bacterium]|nr:hypothetical protein [Candidatus Sumerlaeia bacterium]
MSVEQYLRSPDRWVLEVNTPEEAEASDREYWRSRTPCERLAALEATRLLSFGYRPGELYLPSAFEVVDMPWAKGSAAH